MEPTSESESDSEVEDMEEDGAEAVGPTGEEGRACSNALLVWRFAARMVEIGDAAASGGDVAGASERADDRTAAAAGDGDSHALRAVNGHVADRRDPDAVGEPEAQAADEMPAEVLDPSGCLGVRLT